MNQAERDRFTLLYEKPLEDGHYFQTIADFSDLIKDAYYNDDEEGKKWSYLMECLEKTLGKELVVELYGERF